MQGNELREKRQACHWSRKHVARLFDVHPNTVAKWENGFQNIPRTVEVLMILLEFKDNHALIEKRYAITS